MIETHQVKTYLLDLQQRIVTGLEQLEGQSFMQDSWARTEGGGGLSRVIENGNFFERGGVLFSHVMGKHLPPSATIARPELSGKAYEAMGVSLVLHPHNPHCPTVHLNVRCFNAGDIYWFGGGMDLTPYYLDVADAQHFHQICKQALDPFGPEYYPRFKKWCDDYFYLKHRQEPRGIGGIFFDDLHQPDFASCFSLMQSVGNHFLSAYLPIVERRKDFPYGQKERDFQTYRRGRYVEFNLVYDRGTLFGLQSGGRTESILVSMPPVAQWRYNWHPDPDSPEELLYRKFLIAQDWLNSN